MAHPLFLLFQITDRAHLLSALDGGDLGGHGGANVYLVDGRILFNLGDRQVDVAIMKHRHAAAFGA